MNKYFVVRSAAFLVAFGVVHSANATTFNVNTTADSYTEGDGVCSLREAIDTANFNDCWPDCGCGDATGADYVVLTEGLTYVISNSVGIWGQGPFYLFGRNAVIRADDPPIPFYGLVVSNGGTNNFVEFVEFALENFQNAALLVDQDSSLYAYYLDVRSNTFSPQNGQTSSIQLQRGAGLYLYGSSVHNNTEGPKGAGIFVNEDATLDLVGSTIAFNRATQYGGGIHNQGSVYCSGSSVIFGNYAQFAGGGVYNHTTGFFFGPSSECSVTGNNKKAPDCPRPPSGCSEVSSNVEP